MFLDMPHAKRPKNLLMIFTGVLFLDQILKSIFLDLGDYQKNYGALFGVRMHQTGILLAAAALFILTLFFLRKKERYSFPFFLVFSGIISNLIDRVRLGFIIDYINLFDVFIFNIADLAIVTGAAIFIWRIIRE